jgi:hypothetical protein
VQDDFEDPIASRRLRDSRTGAEVELIVYRPQQESGANGDWFCPIEIRGGANLTKHLCWGVDALQALISGLVFFRYSLKQAGLRQLVWLGQAGDVGLPLIIQENEEFLALLEDVVNVEKRRLGFLLSRLSRPRRGENEDSNDGPEPDSDVDQVSPEPAPDSEGQSHS